MMTQVGGIQFAATGKKLPDGTTVYEAASNGLVKNNKFYNLTYTIIKLNGANHIVENNDISDTNGYDVLYIFGHDHIVRNNYVHDVLRSADNPNHPDFVQTFGHYGDDSYNILIEGNYIRNFAGQIGQLNVTGGYNPVHGRVENWTFRGNVFDHVEAALNIAVPNTTIENNIFLSSTQNTAHNFILGCGDRGCSTNSLVRNNIFVENGFAPNNTGYGFYGIAAGATGSTGDYNYVSGAVDQGYQGKSATAFTDVHGISGGDPLFFDVYNPLGADGIPFTADDGLRPLANSPLCGKGAGGTTIGAYSCLSAEGSKPLAHIQVIPEKGYYEPLKLDFDASKSFVPQGYTITNYSWDFGDGTTSQEMKGQHLFYEGEYTIRLTVKNNLGETHTMTQVLKVLNSPVLNQNLNLEMNGAALDQSGKGMESTWIGTTPNYGEGVEGQAAVFDGTATGSYVRVKPNAYLSGVENLSLSFWTQKAALTDPNSSTYASRDVIHMLGAYRVIENANGWTVVLNNDQGKQVTLTVTGGNNDTNWHHYGVTYDGTTVTLYLDGQIVKTASFSGSIPLKAQDIYIGKTAYSTPALTYYGSMDDVQMYDRALSAAEIQDLSKPQ